MIKDDKDPKKITILTGNNLGLFNSCLSYFDKKNYKKALSITKKILKNNGENGETIALQGLLIHSLNEKDRKDAKRVGYDLVKKGLSISMRHKQHKICVPFCFRVYALMYKNDSNYNKSCASFLNALRFDKDNANVLKDLANTQTHIRDWSGLIKTRRKLIVLQPNVPRFWLSYALALHKSNAYLSAVSILDNWIRQQNEEIRNEKENLKKNDLLVERSRIILYKIYILHECKEYKKVIDELEKEKDNIRDEKTFKKLMGMSYLQIGEKEKAKELFIELLKINPDCYQYVRLYQKAIFMCKDDELLKEMVYDKDESQKLIACYENLYKIIPDSEVIERIILTLSFGEDFKKRFQNFIEKYLRKTIPSIFSHATEFYTNPEKVKIIQDVFTDYENNLQQFSTLHKNQEERECPSTYLWVLVFLAKHYDVLKDYKTAEEYIKKAITHTPTLLELYLVKGRILKHKGEFKKAKEAVELARKLDLADRFVNTKATKYFLLNNEIEAANKICYMFSQDSQRNFNIREMQGIKFEYQVAMAYKRLGKYNLALKDFNLVREYFISNLNMSYEFHDFYLRKCSMIEYMDNLDYFDNIKKNEFYYKSLIEIIQIHLTIFDKPGISKQVKKDEDTPIKIDEKLEESSKFLKDLEEFFKERIDTHILGMKVYWRREKYFLFLKALNCASQIDSNHEYIKIAKENLKNLKIDQFDEISQKVITKFVKEITITVYVDNNLNDINIKSEIPDCTKYNPSTFSCGTGSEKAFVSTRDVHLYLSSLSLDEEVIVLFRKGQVWEFSSDSDVILIRKNHVTISSFGNGGNGDRPVLDGLNTYPSDGTGGVNLQAINIASPGDFPITDVEIMNIEIRNVYPGGGIMFNGGLSKYDSTYTGYGLVRNCYIHNVGWSGIAIYKCKNCSVIIESCEIAQTGIYAKNNGYVSWPQAINGNNGINYGNNIFRNNYVHEIWGEGVGAAAFALVEKNVVRDTKNPAIYFDPRGGTTPQHTIIRYNLVFGTTEKTYLMSPSSKHHGIRVNDETEDGDCSVKTVDIYGNIVINTKDGITLKNGPSDGPGFSNYGRIRVFNNLMINNVQNIEGGYPDRFNEVEVSNNLCVIYDCSTCSQGVFYSGQPDNWVFTSNHFYPEPDEARLKSITDEYSDPELPKKTGWNSLDSLTSFSFEDLIPPEDSTAVDNDKTVETPFDLLLTRGSNFHQLPPRIALARQDETWDFGAIILGEIVIITGGNNETDTNNYKKVLTISLVVLGNVALLICICIIIVLIIIISVRKKSSMKDTLIRSEIENDLTVQSQCEMEENMK